MWCGLITLVTLGAILNWSDGSSLRRPDHVGQSQRSRQLDPSSANERKLQLCSNRLYEGIIHICKNPSSANGFLAAQGLLRQGRAQSQFQQRGNFEYGEDDLGNQNVNESPESLDATRWNLVEACCRRKCSIERFLGYCSVQNRTLQQKATTTTTTTTTTPAPPSQMRFYHHRLARTRVQVPEDIRQEIIRDAIRCLFNPKCAQIDEADVPKSLSKPRQRNKSTSYQFRICSSTGSRRRRRKKAEQSRLLPILIRILTWGMPSTNGNPSEPDPMARVSEPDPPGEVSYLELANEIQNAVLDSAGVNGGHIGGDRFDDIDDATFGVPTILTRSQHGHLHQSLIKSVTDPPIMPELNFGMGTNDGIRFNP